MEMNAPLNEKDLAQWMSRSQLRETNYRWENLFARAISGDEAARQECLENSRHFHSDQIERLVPEGWERVYACEQSHEDAVAFGRWLQRADGTEFGPFGKNERYCTPYVRSWAARKRYIDPVVIRVVCSNGYAYWEREGE